MRQTQRQLPPLRSGREGMEAEGPRHRALIVEGLRGTQAEITKLRPGFILPKSYGPSALGEFWGYDGDWVKADNTNAARRALMVVVEAAPGGYLLRRPDILTWKAHGLGAMGTQLWLGTTGGVVTAEPQGPTVYISQRLGMVLGSNLVLLEWSAPGLEAAA